MLYEMKFKRCTFQTAAWFVTIEVCSDVYGKKYNLRYTVDLYAFHVAYFQNYVSVRDKRVPFLCFVRSDISEALPLYVVF